MAKSPKGKHAQEAEHDHRSHRHGLSPDERERNLKRLKRAEGQVRGIARMLEEDRYCVDILTQISAVQEALRGVAREVLTAHMQHCVNGAAQKGGTAWEEARDELAALIAKGWR